MQAEKHRYALPEGANHSFDVDVSISVDAIEGANHSFEVWEGTEAIVSRIDTAVATQEAAVVTQFAKLFCVGVPDIGDAVHMSR